MPIVIGSVLTTLVGATFAGYFVFGARFRSRLRRHPGFAPLKTQPAWDGVIDYAPPANPILSEFRETHALDAVAGEGSEMERLVRVMQWAHGLTTHAPNPSRPDRMTGLYLTRLALDEGKRFNCWMFATVLNDAYLSLGFASRIVHLWPHRENPNESHVVTNVYSRELEKWVLMDADMCAYVTDEQGIPLGPDEIRERLIRRAPLYVSDTIQMAYASWLGKPLLKRLYLWYLSKNLFRFDCPERSEPDYETRPSGREYVHLIPDGYHDEWLSAPPVTARGNTIHYIRDPAVFWRAPGRH
ncbi:MAG: transglutaminase domain-containing protein, partial [Candidatus Bipolaricaulia bacterium]